MEQFGSQRVVRQLIRHNIALVSTHTNLDYAEKGLCFAMAKTLGLAEIQPVIGPGEEDAGYGRWGCIETMPLRALAQRAKEAFSATTVKYAGASDAPVRTVLTASGSGLQSSAASCFAAGGGCGGYVGCGVQRCAGRRGGRPVRGGCRHFDTEKACCEVWRQTLQTKFDALQYSVRLYTAQNSVDVFKQV